MRLLGRADGRNCFVKPLGNKAEVFTLFDLG